MTTFRSRSRSRSYSTTVLRFNPRLLWNTTLWFIVTNGMLTHAADTCDINDVGIRNCPQNFTHVAKGNKCLRYIESTSSLSDAVRDCLKGGSHLVMIKNSKENQGVFEYLKSQLKTGVSPNASFWIGVTKNKYTDGTPFNKKTDYSNFDNGPEKSCVSMEQSQGKWKYTHCGSSIWGSICEIYPELEPGKPTLGLSGVNISNGEMLVSDGQRIVLKCRAKVGPKGKINFVKQLQAQAWIIEEFEHLGIRRKKGPELEGQTCYIFMEAVLVFYVLKDMKRHSVGCVSDNVTNFRCTRYDPYCTTLPAVFKFKPDPPGQQKKTTGYRESFPNHRISIPDVPKIVVTHEDFPYADSGSDSGPPQVTTMTPANTTTDTPSAFPRRIAAYLTPLLVLFAVALGALFFTRYQKKESMLAEGEFGIRYLNPDVFRDVRSSKGGNSNESVTAVSSESGDRNIGQPIVTRTTQTRVSVQNKGAMSETDEIDDGSERVASEDQVDDTVL